MTRDSFKVDFSYLSLESNPIGEGFIGMQRDPSIVFIVGHQVVLLRRRHLPAPLEQLHRDSFPGPGLKHQAKIPSLIPSPKHLSGLFHRPHFGM